MTGWDVVVGGVGVALLIEVAIRWQQDRRQARRAYLTRVLFGEGR